MTTSLIERDLRHLWHPCSQMKDYESFLPLIIKQAEGCWLTLENGQKVLDAISSWWCKSLGHGHPALKQALYDQLERFEHVILANTTNQAITELSEKLAQLLPNLNKVMYASDGSCAVEIAMKMSLHSRLLQNQPNKTQFAALENSYHGETLATLSVSDLGLYKAPYQSALLPAVTFIKDLPYVSGTADPLWSDCESHWAHIEQQLNPIADHLTALMIEPLLQGAAGMRVYSADLLKRLSAWCQQHDVHLIADEIMTGFGRTGRMLAVDYADICPDFVCLAKGLTAGMLPMSATLTSDRIYQLFYDDYETGKAFMHSHTHTGNALAAAVALKTQELLSANGFFATLQQTSAYLHQRFRTIAENTGKLQNIRTLGMMTAADLVLSPEQQDQRMGYLVYQEAVKQGALLRPLGNTLYWLPPLTITEAEIDCLAEVTEASVTEILGE